MIANYCQLINRESKTVNNSINDKTKKQEIPTTKESRNLKWRDFARNRPAAGAAQGVCAH